MNITHSYNTQSAFPGWEYADSETTIEYGTISVDKLKVNNLSTITGNFKTVFTDLNDFHSKFGFHNGWTPTKQNIGQRLEMMVEELEEFTIAFGDQDKVGMVDALIDLTYFVVGTLDLLGVDGQAHWDAVHNANMKKERGIKASRPNSGGFDCIKPEGWTPPEAEHAVLLEKKGFEFA